jgi:excisionase family DNA binding protein
VKTVLTPSELAAAIGVSESSMRRWIDAGVIATSRTVGGHRRIPMGEGLRFIRESRATVVRPELLGLSELMTIPRADDPGGAALPSAGDRLFDALGAGDEARARGIVLSLYLSGMSVPAISDGPVRDAMHRIGDLWQHSERGILVEHRATMIAIDAVQQLRMNLPEPRTDAPVALGGAPQGDPYLLPTLLAAATLRDAGYREINFGARTPVELLASAAREHRARIVWLAVSVAPDDPRAMQRQVRKLAEELSHTGGTGASPAGGHLVIGGRHAHEALPTRPPPNIHPVQSMTELAAFARGAALASPG